VDEILAGYAAVHANASARGFARAAQAYAELGRVQPVRKLLREAESRLKKGDSDGHLALAVAYAAAGTSNPRRSSRRHCRAYQETARERRRSRLVGIAQPWTMSLLVTLVG